MAYPYQPVPTYGQYPGYPPQIPHPQQQALRPGPGSYQPNVQNLPGPQPYFNPPRFDAHASLPSPNPFPTFTPSFPPEMFRHFTPSNPPPPPLPSVPPLPYSAPGFMPFPPQPHQQPAYSDRFTRQQNISAYDGSQPSTMWTRAEQQDKNLHPEPTPETLYPDRPALIENASEDGEVSDAEVEGSEDAFANQSSRTISQDDATIPPQSDPWKAPGGSFGAQTRSDPEMPKQQFPPHRISLPPNVSPTRAQIKNDIVLSDGGESASSYNPPSASTPGSVHSLLDSLQTQINATEDHKDPTQSEDLSDVAPKSSSAMRELAKGALLSLAPHNIRLQELTGEGVDEHILRELYTELGMKSILDTTSILTKLSQESSHSPSYNIAPMASSLISSSAQRISDPKTVISIQPTPSPLLERKDRIAQLLAAKTGKLPASRNTPDMPSPVLALKAMPTSQEPSTVSRQSPQAAVSVSGPSSAGSLMVPLKSQMTSQNEVQSELHRAAQGLPSARDATSHSETKAPDREASEDTPTASSELFEIGRALLRLPEPSEGQRPTDEPMNARATPSMPSLIPGLFMTSADYRSTKKPDFQPVNLLEASSSQPKEAELNFQVSTIRDTMLSTDDDIENSQRVPKRPLAADPFDEVLQPPAKRVPGAEISSNAYAPSSAGESRDDVSEGEIMETDEVALPCGLPEKDSHHDVRRMDQFASTVSTRSSPPPLEVFHHAAGSTPPTVSSAIPSSVKTGGTGGNGNLYLAKHQEIEAMRRKIAEAEERQKQKRSQSQLGSSRSSGQNTPVASRAVPSLALLSSPTSAENGTDQDAMAAKAAALKAEVLRQRALRRKTLQDGIPDLDEEVQRTRSKLAEAQARLSNLKAENERREAERIAALQQQEDIIAEAMRLEAQLQQGLTGQRQYSDELQNLDGDAEAKVLSNVPMSPDPLANGRLGPGDFSPEVQQKIKIEEQVEQSHPEHAQLINSTDAESSTAMTPDINSDIESLDRARSRLQSVSSRKESLSDNASQQADKTLTAYMNESGNPVPGAESLINGGTTAELFEAAESASREEDAPLDHEFRSGEDLSDPGQSPMDVGNESDGSASMSDSASDNYEPEEPHGRDTYPDADESDEYDPEEAPIIPPQPPLSQVEDQGDEYEPAESVVSPQTTASQDEPSKSDAQMISISGTSTQVDGGEDGLQLTEAITLTKPQETPILVDDAVISDGLFVPSESNTRFVPYQSPLASLKSFRFNPTYKDKVKGGYRSMTYSYNIDPKRPLCPTELSGESCSDPTCEEQHFPQMALADAKILEQLASAHDIADKIQRDRFLAGVKQVIADLRVRKVKEFSEVANELAAYRRRFREEQNPALLAPTS